MESDPTGRNACDEGAKMDSGKVQASLLMDFSAALTAVAEVATYGAAKYSRGGWLKVPNAIERYTDAMWRHLLAEQSESVDKDSNLTHIAMVAWNALARLELTLRDEKEFACQIHCPVCETFLPVGRLHTDVECKERWETLKDEKPKRKHSRHEPNGPSPFPEKRPKTWICPNCGDSSTYTSEHSTIQCFESRGRS